MGNAESKADRLMRENAELKAQIEHKNRLFEMIDAACIDAGILPLDTLAMVRTLASSHKERQEYQPSNAPQEHPSRPYFAYDGEQGFLRFETAKDARDSSLETLNSFRAEARSDGEWANEVKDICWGVILGATKEIKLPDDGYDGSQGVADYRAPVDYFLAESTFSTRATTTQQLAAGDSASGENQSDISTSDRDTIFQLFRKNCLHYSGNYEISPGQALQIAKALLTCNASKEQDADLQAIQWRNINKVLKAVADFSFGSKDDPQWGAAYLSVTQSLTANDGLDLSTLGLEPLSGPASQHTINPEGALVLNKDDIQALAMRLRRLCRETGYSGDLSQQSDRFLAEVAPTLIGEILRQLAYQKNGLLSEQRGCSQTVSDADWSSLFTAWWESHGKLVRAGGGEYEMSFAFEAWRFLYPQLMQARADANRHRQ